MIDKIIMFIQTVKELFIFVCFLVVFPFLSHTRKMSFMDKRMEIIKKRNEENTLNVKKESEDREI